MKRTILIVAALAVAVPAVLLLSRARTRFLDVVVHIEYEGQDVWRHMLGVSPEGTVYALQKSKDTLQIEAFAPDGQAMWREAIPGGSDKFGAAVVSIEGGETFAVRLAELGERTDFIWITVNADGHIGHTVVSVGPIGLSPYVKLAPTPQFVYVTGGEKFTHGDYPTMIKIDRSGRRLWKRIETSNDISGPAAVDSKGNIILIGDIGAGVGPYVLKHSADGQRMWRRSTVMWDGTTAVWTQVDQRDRIYTIFRLHEGIMASSGDDDTNKQDHVLSVFSPNGKLLRTTKLSHGNWLDLTDADINAKGEVIAVGICSYDPWWESGRKHQDAQLIKCDTQGNVVWSFRVKLPSGYYAKRVRLDEHGGIYISGFGEGTNGNKSFIVKVLDPDIT